MPVSEKTYRRVALEDPNGQWELHRGQLRRKPPMAAEHNEVMTRLFGRLFQQLDEQEYAVRSNSGRTQRSPEHYYVPDVCVVPRSLVRPLRGRPNTLEAYSDPLPLVIEVWSPSTGDFDVETKLPEYQRRGDLEIWRVHPYDRTLTAWRRQPDGSYVETLYTTGIVRPAALPGATIDPDKLFE